MIRPRFVALALIGLFGIVACAGPSSDGLGSGLGSDASDSGTDAGPDAGSVGAEPDAGTDAGPDGGTDLDGGPDAGPAPDAGLDAGPADAGPGDGGTDGGPSACAGLAACSPCGTGAVCVQGVCAPSVCGDGCLDVARGEQCDDGNTTNLDGCDSRCRFEQDQRATSLKLQMPPSATDANCPANAIGNAIQYSTAQTDVQNSIDAKVASGIATVAFKVLGLSGLTGAGSQTVQLGAVSAAPYVAPAGLSYDGTHDLDWWYASQRSSLDLLRNPTSRLDGKLSGGQLSASGNIRLMLDLGGAPSEASLSGTTLHATIGPATAPTASTGATPGHPAGEHLDPAIRTFASMSAGELCGNVSAASLARSPLPALISSAHCAETYDSSSNMLDLFVSGCTAYGIITAIAGTQPDQVDPTVPAAGAGGPYRLSASSGTKVDGCADATGAPVNLQACLDSAAYSIFFKFATDRVILK